MKSGKVCILQTFNSVNNPRAADQPWASATSASATSELVGLASATSVSATSELVGLNHLRLPAREYVEKRPSLSPARAILWSVTSEVIHSFKIIHL